MPYLPYPACLQGDEMKKAILLIALIVLAWFQPTMAGTNIFVIPGQSNAAPVPMWTKQQLLDAGVSMNIPSNVLYFVNSNYTNGVTVFCSRISDQPVAFGYEVGMIPLISEAYPDDLNVILKYSRHGTGMDRWTEGADLYGELLLRIREIRGMYPGAEVKGLFWIQGESDAAGTVVAKLYKSRMKAMIEGLRRDLDLPDLKFFIATIFSPFPYNASVVADQLAIADEDPNAWAVSTEHLGMRNDWVHLDGAGAYNLGRRFMATLLQSEGREVEPTPDLVIKYSYLATPEGLWRCNGTRKTLVAPPPISQMVTLNNTAYFASNGLWQYDGTNLMKMHTSAPVDMIVYGPSVVAIYDALYRNNGTGWTRIAQCPFPGMSVAGMNLYANFPAIGPYRFDGRNWERVE